MPIKREKVQYLNREMWTSSWSRGNLWRHLCLHSSCSSWSSDIFWSPSDHSSWTWLENVNGICLDCDRTRVCHGCDWGRTHRHTPLWDTSWARWPWPELRTSWSPWWWHSSFSCRLILANISGFDYRLQRSNNQPPNTPRGVSSKSFSLLELVWPITSCLTSLTNKEANFSRNSSLKLESQCESILNNN